MNVRRSVNSVKIRIPKISMEVATSLFVSTVHQINSENTYCPSRLMCDYQLTTYDLFQNTNVVELYSRIIKDDTQPSYYNSGIGTYATPSWRSLTFWKQVIYNKIDLAIAWYATRPSCPHILIEIQEFRASSLGRLPLAFGQLSARR